MINYEGRLYRHIKSGGIYIMLNKAKYGKKISEGMWIIVYCDAMDKSRVYYRPQAEFWEKFEKLTEEEEDLIAPRISRPMDHLTEKSINEKIIQLSDNAPYGKMAIDKKAELFSYMIKAMKKIFSMGKGCAIPELTWEETEDNLCSRIYESQFIVNSGLYYGITEIMCDQDNRATWLYDCNLHWNGSVVGNLKTTSNLDAAKEICYRHYIKHIMGVEWIFDQL